VILRAAGARQRRVAHNGPMGIFQSRPEDPSQWGGLPADPPDQPQPAEVLPPPVDDLGVFGAAGVAISVPVETFLPHAAPSADADRDGDDESGDLDSP
jgi:hypothetical protein